MPSTMSDAALTRLVVAAVFALVVAIVVWRIWVKARGDSYGGHPMSGLPLAFAWIATLVIIAQGRRAAPESVTDPAPDAAPAAPTPVSLPAPGSTPSA